MAVRKSECLARRTGVFGFSSFEVACSFGAMEAIDELLLQRETDVSRGLHMAMVFRGGTATLVNKLISLRADVNWQWKEPWLTFHGIYNHIQALRFRMGKRSTSGMMAHHINGATPLMLAVMSGQYEGAAALIAAGARLDLRNEHKCSVSDFARQLSVPKFLSQALDGNPEDCLRIAEIATRNHVFEIWFVSLSHSRQYCFIASPTFRRDLSMREEKAASDVSIFASAFAQLFMFFIFGV